MRQVYSYQRPDRVRSAVVFYDFEYEEFVVRFYDSGIPLRECDYHTNDRTDAIGTAQLAVSEAA
jgi:hypothetical protein